VAPSQKAEGIVRLVYENVNGLRAQHGGNQKLSKLKVVLDDLEADIFAFNEHKNNLKHKLNERHGLNHLFLVARRWFKESGGVTDMIMRINTWIKN
jgi:hypothetical protein